MTAEPLSAEEERIRVLSLTLGFYLDDEMDQPRLNKPSVAESVVRRLLADDGWLATLDAARQPSGDLAGALREARAYLASGSNVPGVIAFIDAALRSPDTRPEPCKGEHVWVEPTWVCRECGATEEHEDTRPDAGLREAAQAVAEHAEKHNRWGSTEWCTERQHVLALRAALREETPDAD